MSENRFKCSAEAARTWGRLISCFEWWRASLERDRSSNRETKCVWGGHDPQAEGHKWDGNLSLSKGQHSDLGTDARTLYWDAERALSLLECIGPDELAASRLAKRSLGRQRKTDVRVAFGLTFKEADELLEGAKEYLHWSLSEDAPTELPDLPFGTG